MSALGVVECCDQDQGKCGRDATTVVVTINGWLIDLCETHARQLCDPLSTDPTSPEPE